MIGAIQNGVLRGVSSNCLLNMSHKKARKNEFRCSRFRDDSASGASWGLCWSPLVEPFPSAYDPAYTGIGWLYAVQTAETRRPLLRNNGNFGRFGKGVLVRKPRG